jgi:hypothetical protein
VIVVSVRFGFLNWWFLGDAQQILHSPLRLEILLQNLPLSTKDFITDAVIRVPNAP